MSGRYGMSFAKKRIEDGEYDEAVALTTGEITDGTASPDTYVDRATAYDFMERYEEAVADFEKAIALDVQEGVLAIEDVDDAYFSALVAAAQKLAQGSVDAGVSYLDRYTKTLPSGRHVGDLDDWKKRLTGELKSLLDRT